MEQKCQQFYKSMFGVTTVFSSDPEGEFRQVSETYLMTVTGLRIHAS